MLLVVLSGWVNRRQQEIIEFQNAQIRVLMERLARKRILLTDRQRRVLAAKGKALGRKTLMELTTIVTPYGAINRPTPVVSRNSITQCPKTQMKCGVLRMSGLPGDEFSQFRPGLGHNGIFEARQTQIFIRQSVSNILSASNSCCNRLSALFEVGAERQQIEDLHKFRDLPSHLYCRNYGKLNNIDYLNKLFIVIQNN